MAESGASFRCGRTFKSRVCISQCDAMQGDAGGLDAVILPRASSVPTVEVCMHVLFTSSVTECRAQMTLPLSMASTTARLPQMEMETRPDAPHKVNELLAADDRPRSSGRSAVLPEEHSTSKKLDCARRNSSRFLWRPRMTGAGSPRQSAQQGVKVART